MIMKGISVLNLIEHDLLYTVMSQSITIDQSNILENNHTLEGSMKYIYITKYR